MLFQTMFALAFHAFFRIGEITVCTKSDNYEHLLKVSLAPKVPFTFLDIVFANFVLFVFQTCLVHKCGALHPATLQGAISTQLGYAPYINIFKSKHQMTMPICVTISLPRTCSNDCCC